MPLMNFDLEDGLEPVSFTLKLGDAERFMAFMAECNGYMKQRDELVAALIALETANDKRCGCLSGEAYLVAEKCDGMTEALYRLDEARFKAREIIKAMSLAGMVAHNSKMELKKPNSNEPL
jgi:hypothetical protein